jgi:hypothetical protein
MFGQNPFDILFIRTFVSTVERKRLGGPVQIKVGIDFVCDALQLSST